MELIQQSVDFHVHVVGTIFRCFDGRPSILSTDVAQCMLANDMALTFSIMIAMGVFCFIASAVTNNDSWVDRLWSVIPVVYAWCFAAHKANATGAGGSYSANSASFAFTILVTMWGIRLTYNFYRRGGYKKGGEDYRWAYVRTWPVFQLPLVWHIFSFLVVSVFQSWLLWAITVPLAQLPNTPLTTADRLFASMFLFFLALETLTDQQQWEFQSEKRHLKRRRLGVDYSLGFCVDGVFAFSRHMNVWSEQCVWISVFLAGASHNGSLCHPMVVGCITLVALTIGSTRLTEQLSSRKYPEYKIYQATTPMLVPSIRACDGLTTHRINQWRKTE